MCSCTHANVSCSTLHSSLYVLMSHAGWKGTLRALGLIPSPLPDATLQSVGYMLAGLKVRSACFRTEIAAHAGSHDRVGVRAGDRPFDDALPHNVANTRDGSV